MIDESEIISIVEKQRVFFNKGKTKDISFRVKQLKKLKSVIEKNKEEIIESLSIDMRRHPFESKISETEMIKSEINFAIKNINSWTKPKKVKTSITTFPSYGEIFPEPFGLSLIISPWNYPFQLCFVPLVGSISAGNCSLIKPSEISPNTSKLIAKIVNESFDPDFVCAIQGNVSVAKKILCQKFDYIFFTGGTLVAKHIMVAAAENLTPITLELGGKSPCIVDKDIKIDETAKRIVWGKFFNAGQVCIAPDYLLVQKEIKEELIEKIKYYIHDFYGKDPKKSSSFARIINERHFDRICKFFSEGKIIEGGSFDKKDLYIAPTLIDDVSLNFKVMKEEIFGPVLPILEYKDQKEAILIVNKFPKPLSLYFFSSNKSKQNEILKNTSSGGVCINDTILHFGERNLPFGGVGDSGIGKYHGKATFDLFSNKKSVLKRSFSFDITSLLRFPPHSKKKFKK